MDTQQKLGISKRHAILLFVLMILTIAGFAAQVGILIFVTSNNLETIMVISSLSIILAYIAVFVYAIYGYKKTRIYYIVAIAFFLLAILVNNILPFRDAVQKIFLTLLFACMFAFIFTQEKFKLSNVLIIVAAVVSLAFSIYSSITADVNSLGSVENSAFPVIMMFTSIFTPVVMSALFGVTYLCRTEKNSK